jgi:hypothetical protein
VSEGRVRTPCGAGEGGPSCPSSPVFRPSRRVALEKTLFDTYWGGTADATVPVRYGDPVNRVEGESGLRGDEDR